MLSASGSLMHGRKTNVRHHLDSWDLIIKNDLENIFEVAQAAQSFKCLHDFWIQIELEMECCDFSVPMEICQVRGQETEFPIG